MYGTATLPPASDLSTLQALLPVLLEVESCCFSGSPLRVEMAFDGGRSEAIADSLARAVHHIGSPWDWQLHERPRRLPEQLHELEGLVLTVIAPTASGLPMELAATLVEWDVRLRAMRTLSRGSTDLPVAFELYFVGPSEEALRPKLQALGTRWGVDLVLQRTEEKRPRRRLCVFDMDSTLIECEVIDELAARAGVGERVAAITERAMRGELDFKGSFRERLAMLRGLPDAEVNAVAAALPVMPGARRLLRTLRAQGHYTAILSGGFEIFARRLRDQLGLHEVFANDLDIVDGALTGAVAGEIIDGERKARLLAELAEREGFDLADTVAVGDGANDLPMLGLAGTGVAFRAKPRVRERARHALNESELDALLYVLGVPEPV